MGPRAVNMYYLGPDDKSKADRFFDNVKNVVVVSAHARFTEELEPIDTAEIYVDDTQGSDQMVESFKRKLEDDLMWGDNENVTHVTRKGDEPAYKDAILSDDKEQWQEAIMDEYQSLKKMNTFREIDRNDLPKGSKVVTSKWVLKKREIRTETLIDTKLGW